MPYDSEELAKFHQSGKILREVREEMRGYVKENMLALEVCEKAEGLIRSKGGKPAFPVNVSIDHITAHYTAVPGDKTLIPAGCTAKIDIGVQIDGYVTDTAFTAAFNPEGKAMTQTSELALKTAIEVIHGGIQVGEIGAAVEKTIKNRGFRPISNLTGHSVGRYLIHAGTSIPSVSGLNPRKLEVGGVYAVEPFVTTPDAAGMVDDLPQTTIYRYLKGKSLKTDSAKKLIKYIEKEFHTLPFAERWTIGVLAAENHKAAFKELLASKSIMAYPVFAEVSGKPVAQAEHTLLITESGCEVLT